MLGRLSRAGRKVIDLLKDLFYGPGNKHLDLARIIGALFAGLAAFAIYWNAVHLDKEIDLAAALGGLTALAGGVGGLIAAKDWVRSKFDNNGGGQ